MLIDTHTHLFAEEFDLDRDAIIERALSAGINKLLLPNINSASIHPMLELEKRYKGQCFAMMGLHPCYITENYLTDLEIIEGWLSKRKFIAVGEIGMDYHWDKTFILQQKDAFSKQIDLAKKYSLPIVIHQRECFDDLFEIVLSKNDNTLKGVFHCFTGTNAQAQKIISLGGFKMGIGGGVTYKNAGIADVLKDIDLKHIVLETDSPYLTPVPYRGKRNESAYIKIVAQKVSEIKNISIDEVARVTTQNSEEIFGKMN